MNKKSTHIVRGADYIPDIEMKMASSEEKISIRQACKSLAEEAVSKGRVPPDKKKAFTEAIRKAYQRQKKHADVDAPSIHGNCSLSHAEEQMLVGFLQGYVRTGTRVTKQKAISLANHLFHDLNTPLGGKWWKGFKYRNRDWLTMGRSKDTSQLRTSPETLNNVEIFCSRFGDHLDSTFCCIFSPFTVDRSTCHR